MPGYNVQNQPGIGDASQAFADMLAATLRGATKATLGFPGDIEGLGRMGINALGGNVSPEPAMRTTEEWSKALPPLGTKNPYEDIGQFAPVNAVGPAVKGLKGAASIANALRTVSPAAEVGTAADMGRRGALQLLGKGAGVAAAGTVAPMAVVKALKAASPEVKALAPEAKLGAKEAVKVVSRLTPAQLRVGDALESISNWSGTQLPAHFDDIMRGARELRPGASDDAIAKGIANFEQLYHQGHASFYFDSLPQTGKFKGLGWSELNKQGIKTQQDLFGAVFDGKIKPSQLQEDIFAGRHIDGPGPASNLFNDMLGHAEGDSAFPSGEKYAEILKYFDDLEEVSKHTGNPSAVTDSIREQARDWASDTRRW